MELKEIKENTYELTKDTYLSKTKLGEWRITRPVIIQGGKIHWPNLLYGGKISNIIILLILVSLILFVSWSYERDIRECKYLIENLPRCECIASPGMNMMGINYTQLGEALNQTNKAGDNEFNISLLTQDNDKIN